MTLPMAATEGSVTPWFLLTLAMGGQLFDDEYNPRVRRPELGRIQGAAVGGRRDQQRLGLAGLGDARRRSLLERFLSGAAAINLAAAPGNLPEANDLKVSAIAGDAEAALVPGIDGPGASFGLQEGYGIPVTAEHKDAAKVFIEWMLEPEHQIELYEGAGFRRAARRRSTSSPTAATWRAATSSPRSSTSSSRCFPTARRSGTRSSARRPRAC